MKRVIAFIQMVLLWFQTLYLLIVLRDENAEVPLDVLSVVHLDEADVTEIEIAYSIHSAD